MTKYILNSGATKRHPEKTILFFQEMIKGLGKEPRILSCSFAEKRENWEEKFAAYTESFAALMPSDIKPKFTMAMPDTFAQQVKDSDIISMSGGDDHLLMYWLKQFNLPELWEGKVVATSSASSNILSKHFWTNDWRRCFDGLGILPIKFLPHYKSDFGADDPRGPIDYDQAYRDLADYGDRTLPIYALEEGDFVVFER